MPSLPTPEHELLRDHYRFLSDLHDRLRHEGDPHVVLEETTRRLAMHLGVNRTGYGEFNDDASIFYPRAIWTDGSVAAIDTRIPFSAFGPQITASHRAGELWIHDSLDDAKLDADGQATCRALGIVAAITIPVLKDGRLRSLLSVHQNEVRQWKPSEVALVSALADSTWATLERVRAEEERAESEALLSALLQHAPIGIFLKSDDGRFKLVNDAMARLLGRTREEMIGHSSAELFDAHTAAAIEAADRATLASGEPVAIEAAAPDGATYAFGLTTRFPVQTRSGPALAGFLIDVSERRRADAELAVSREQLYQSEKIAALGSLLAGVSHELNNPLAIIVAQAEMLAREAEGTSAAQRVGRIRRAAEQSARIVQTFLAMARQKAPSRAVVDLPPVVAAALDLVQYGLTTSKVMVRVDHAPDLPPVNADADQLQQVVINLIVNAHQAMMLVDRPRVLTITTARDGSGRMVVLDIADTGPGIPPEYRRRVFEPFFTTKPEGVGTGVGLSFSQGIVEAHDGRLELVESGPTGTRFRISLPIATATGERAPADDTAALLPPTRRQALVIDDEPDVAETIADVLRVLQVDAVAVFTAAEAQALIGARHFDLIISDFRMPDLDGQGLYEWLRATHPEAAASFVFSTGDTLGSVSQTYIAASGRPILEKPFTVASVRALVAQLCP